MKHKLFPISHSLYSEPIPSSWRGFTRLNSPRNFGGFTIVELLVVMVVIGILASITIVAYQGVTQRATIASLQSDLTNAQKDIELYKLDNHVYPNSIVDCPTPAPGNICVVSSGGASYQYSVNNSNPSTFCITETINTTNYKITNDNASTSGGCAGHGLNGLPPITNLASNPSVEVNGTSWASRWFGASGATGTTVLSSSAALFGGQGYRKTWTIGGGGQDIGFYYSLPVTVGKVYNFSAYIRASVVTEHKMFVYWNGTANTLIGPVVSIPANTWYRLSATGTAPTGTTSAGIVWGPYPPSGSPGSVAGQTIDFDGVMVTEGSTLYNYADGSSPNWVWNGATNASTSTGPRQ